MRRLASLFSILAVVPVLMIHFCSTTPLDPTKDPENAGVLLTMVTENGDESSVLVEDSAGCVVQFGLKPLLIELIDSVKLRITGNGLDTSWLVTGMSLVDDTTTWVNFTFAGAGSYRIYATSYKAQGLTSQVAASVLIYGRAAQTIGVAPKVVIHPVDLVLTEGASFSLNILALSSNAVQYQWYKDGNAINGAVDSFYTLSQVSFADSGAYWCIVYNELGADTSKNASITVSAELVTGLSILSRSRDEIYVAGAAAALWVNVVGPGPFGFRWFRDGTEIPGENSDILRFESIELVDSGCYTVQVNNATDTAVSSCIKISVTLSAVQIFVSSGPHGTIQPGGTNGVVTAAFGGSADFEIIPDSGYKISGILIDSIADSAAAGTGKYSFTSLSSDHSISASFSSQKFSLVVNSTNGTVTIDPELAAYPFGTTVRLTAVANQGSDFAGWSGASKDTSPTIELVIDGDKEVTANFAELGSFALNLTALNGKIIRDPDLVSYLSGTKVKLTAVPDEGYRFVGWVGDTVVAESSSISLVVSSHREIEARCVQKTYSVNVNVDSGGVVNPAGPVIVGHGGTVSFNVIPKQRYHTENIVVDGRSAGTNSPLVLTNVVSNTMVNVYFAPDTFTVTASASLGGSIAPAGSLRVESGRNLGFRITPESGLVISEVLVDSVSVGTIDTFTLTTISANHSIEAVFKTKSYAIQVIAGANGSISPSESVTIEHGGSKVFAITPVVGYDIADVLVDGVSKGAIVACTLSNVISEHTIAASFAVKKLTISAIAGPNGTIAPSGDITAEYGTNKSFVVSPSANYHIDEVLIGGVSKGAVSTYTFTNIVSDDTIEAHFAINTYPIYATAGPGGHIEPSGTVAVAHGTSKLFSITPDEGYDIQDVKVAGVSVGAVASYNLVDVIAEDTIIASFIKKRLVITATAGLNGTIAPGGDVEIEYGADTTFQISASTNYHIADVLVGGISKGAIESYTYTDVVLNSTIAASFAIDTHEILATAEGGGTIEPSGAVTVDHGASKIFSITPNSGGGILDVLVNGVSVGAVASYTFETVTSKATIKAIFVPDPIAHWSFETSTENTYPDVTGNGYTAIDSSGSNLDLVPGVKGNALHTSITSHEISVPNSTGNFNFAYFSVEATVYSDVDLAQGGGEAGFHRIFENTVSDVAAEGYTVSVSDQGYIYVSVAKAGVSGWYSFTSLSKLEANTWYHIVVTYDGQYVRLYLNGTKEHEGACGATYQPCTKVARIGSMEKSGNVFAKWQGMLDEIKLYDEALSDGAVLSRYNVR